jgi:hypothetical protein
MQIKGFVIIEGRKLKSQSFIKIKIRFREILFK